MEIARKYSKVGKLVIMFIMFYIFTYLIKYYFQPFLVILVMILLTNPIYNLICKSKIPKWIGSIISLLFVNIVIFFILFYLGNNLVYIINKLYEENSQGIDVLVNNIKILLHFDFDKIINSGSKILTSSIVRDGVTLTGDGIIAYILGNISVFFLLVDKKKFYNLLINIFDKRLFNLFVEKKKKLIEVLKVEAILICISMVIIIIGFTIFRIPNGVFLGVICGVLDILPYVGTIIVFIPIIIYNIIVKNYLIVVGLIALYLLVQIIREILEAKFLSSKLDIHPLVIMLSIYIGVRIFGFIGILMGPAYCIIAKDIIYENK